MVQAPNRPYNDRDRDRDRSRGRERDEDTGGFTERVVYTRRIAKVVKGGRRLRFNALVVVGDGQNEVGVGLGKALVIPDAGRQRNAVARRDTVKIPLRGTTIPQKITVKKGATIVMIKPAGEGTGVIAAGAMRAILELGGVKDVVGKSMGSRNPINIVYATMEALRQLKDPDVELARRFGRPLPSEENKVITVPVEANLDEPQTNAGSLEPENVETLMSERPGETLEGD